MYILSFGNDIGVKLIKATSAVLLSVFRVDFAFVIPLFLVFGDQLENNCLQMLTLCGFLVFFTQISKSNGQEVKV